MLVGPAGQQPGGVLRAAVGMEYGAAGGAAAPPGTLERPDDDARGHAPRDRPAGGHARAQAGRGGETKPPLPRPGVGDAADELSGGDRAREVALGPARPGRPRREWRPSSPSWGPCRVCPAPSRTCARGRAWRRRAPGQKRQHGSGAEGAARLQPDAPGGLPQIGPRAVRPALRGPAAGARARRLRHAGRRRHGMIRPPRPHRAALVTLPGWRRRGRSPFSGTRSPARARARACAARGPRRAPACRELCRRAGRAAPSPGAAASRGGAPAPRRSRRRLAGRHDVVGALRPAFVGAGARVRHAASSSLSDLASRTGGAAIRVRGNDTAQHPRALAGTGAKGRPGAVGQRTRRGAPHQGWEIKGKDIVEIPKARGGPSGPWKL